MDLASERRYVEATFAHPDLWRDWLDAMPPDRPLRSLVEVLSFGMAGYARVGKLLRDSLTRHMRAGAVSIRAR
jgi:cellulose synthase (UDP-forming)